MSSHLAELLQTLPETSPEYTYHAVIGNLALMVPFNPASESQGFGLIHLLAQGTLSTRDLDTTSSPAAGSIEETCLLVTHLFHEIHQDASWWKSNYPTRIFDDETLAATRWWAHELSLLPGVFSIYCPA